MTAARERVLNALNHKRVDRVPVDFFAVPAVSDKLVDRLGLQDYDDLLEALQVDMRRIGGYAWHGQPRTEPDEHGFVKDMWGIRHRYAQPEAKMPVESICPFDEKSTLDDVANHPWPDADNLDFSEVAELCAKYHGEYVTYGSPWCPFFHEVGNLLGQENFLVWMHTRPEFVHAVIDRVVEYELDATRKYLEATHGKLDLVYFGNDFGTQLDLFISPPMWQEFMQPSLKQFYALGHDYGCRVMQHSCGAIRGIIPQLIEIGVDVLDPIQVNAANMDFASLYDDFAGLVTLHGGVDTQTVLPFGSTQEVEDTIRRYAARGVNGSYILCGSQEFIEDIPLDNILKMYEVGLRSVC